MKVKRFRLVYTYRKTNAYIYIYTFYNLYYKMYTQYTHKLKGSMRMHRWDVSIGGAQTSQRATTCECDYPSSHLNIDPALFLSEITSGRVHLDVCWVDQCTSLPSGLTQMLLIYPSIHHTHSKWTLPLGMSLRHRKRQIFQGLVMANLRHSMIRGPLSAQRNNKLVNY